MTLHLRCVGLAVGCLLQMAVPTQVPAQAVFGGICGVVRDARGPVEGARVSLEGAPFATETDRSGRYVLERVTPGAYVVRVEGAGGAAAGERAVRVPAGPAVTVDLQLGTGGTERTEAPGARMGVAGVDLARLPIDDARGALALLPGVVSRGATVGIAGTPSMTIRGSAGSQTAVTIDGAPARFDLLGVQGPVLGLGGIASMEVEAGVAPADVADARGAAIAFVTRSGGSKLEGGVSAGSEEPFGYGSTVGYTRIEGTLGGPVPGVRRLTFFVAGSLQGQPSAYRGSGAGDLPTYELAGVDTVIEYATQAGQTVRATLPRFAQVSGRCGTTGNANTAVGRDIQSNYGYACQGLRQPLDWSTSRRALAKLHYTYGAGSSLSVTGVASDLQRRYFPGADIGASGLYEGARTRSWLAVADWKHALGRMGPGGVTLKANVSYGSDAWQSGPLDIASSVATAAPALGIEMRTLRFTGADVISFPDLGGVIENMRIGRSPIAPYPNRNDLDPFQTFRSDPYGMAYGWPTQGIDGYLTLAQEHRLNARLAAEWEARRGILLSAGADMSRTDVAFYDADLLSDYGVDAFVAHPRRSGLFASARVENGDVSVEAGLRADRFDAGADFPKVPGRLFSNPAAVPPAGGDTSYAAFVARVYAPSRPQTLLTPRIRMTFRLGPRTLGHLGYGEHVAPPPLRDRYAGINSDLNLNSFNFGFGQDVRLVKTRILEVNVSHSFSARWKVDLAVYRKTGVAPYVYRIEPVWDPFLLSTIDLGILTTTDDRVMGADARLEWRAGAALSGSLVYSFQQTHLIVDTTPMSIGYPDQSTHAVAAWVAFEVPDGWRAGSWLGTALRGVRADVTAHAMSGLPYTRTAINAGEGIIAPDIGGSYLGTETIGGAHLPWNYLADLRVAKTIAAGGTRWTAYLEVRNLLNTANLIGAFAETGSDVNDQFRVRLQSPEFATLQVEAPAGALATDGTVDLTRPCSAWRNPANCVALQRVENRFGDGDGLYTLAEQRRALDAYYDSVYGTWRFHGPARTARVGVELRF